MNRNTFYYLAGLGGLAVVYFGYKRYVINPRQRHNMEVRPDRSIFKYENFRSKPHPFTSYAESSNNK
jgi:hypothetical protein